MVAGYLAKYATKSTEVTGHRSVRLTADTIGDYADPDGDHTARLIDACWHTRPTHHHTRPALAAAPGPPAHTRLRRPLGLPRLRHPHPLRRLPRLRRPPSSRP